MDNAAINEVLAQLVDDFSERDGYWSLQHGEIPIHILTDESRDRIRIFAPAELGGDLADAGFLYRLLRANFETALDARYCVWRGTLYAAFLHPLSKLDRGDFIDAVEQVVTLVQTTGEGFCSTGLRFGQDESH